MEMSTQCPPLHSSRAGRSPGGSSPDAQRVWCFLTVMYGHLPGNAMAAAQPKGTYCRCGQRRCSSAQCADDL